MGSGIKRTPKSAKPVGGVKSSGKKNVAALSSAEKRSAKKLVQARLPFKTITPTAGEMDVVSSGSSVASVHAEKSTDTRKRKLSYSQENESDLETTEGSKENVKEATSAATTKKLKSVKETVNEKNGDDRENDGCIILLSDDDRDETLEKKKEETLVEKQSAKLKTGLKNKQTTLGTEKHVSVDKNTKSAKGPPKQQRKSGKNSIDENHKRRKSLRSCNNHKEAEQKKKEELTAAEELSESSDDITLISEELNPQKRAKLDEENIDSKEDEPKTNKATENKSKSESAQEKKKQEKEIISNKQAEKVDKKINEAKVADTNQIAKEPQQVKDVNRKGGNSDKMNDTMEAIESESSTDENDEADDESDITMSAANNAAPALNKSTLNLKSNAAGGKQLTPKQLKLQESRRKAREEKEQKLQEEKLQKQREKEIREQAKKREREEKEEQRRLEREEKEEQKRLEREAKERKRMAEQEAKNEEKRKRNEAREEEQRKKDDEKRRKEQEKEEAELKKKRAAEAFTKFFVAKTSTNAGVGGGEGDSQQQFHAANIEKLAFAPFQVKGDMQLAPLTRKDFCNEQRINFDSLVVTANDSDNSDQEKEEDLVSRKPLPRAQLYLEQLGAGAIKPGRWRRPTVDVKADDEVHVIEDDLERVGQAIVDEQKHPTERLRAKFFKFCENRRPPYYGTWRKQSKSITARRPFAQDPKFFDYEVDSDAEWEEEEPGESLEGTDDEKDKESEEDDYEVDNEWFVPHGHLSDEELQNEEEFGGDDNMREAQKAKLHLLQQEFVQEMKKETKKIKPRLIGCIWVDTNGERPNDCPNIIWETLNKRAMMCNGSITLEEPKPNDALDADSDVDEEKKLKPLVLDDEELKKLARLIHGNNHSKVFLINEYLAHLGVHAAKLQNNEALPPTKTWLREKIDEYAEWKAVDIERSNTSKGSAKKAKKPKKRMCWVVNEEVLDYLDLGNLRLENNWTYTLPPKYPNDNNNMKDAQTDAKLNTTTDTPPTPMDCEVDDDAVLDVTLTEKEMLTEPKAKTDSKVRKRVPLLMSVARGEHIPTKAKNALISQFLKKNTTKIKEDSLCAAAEQESIKDDDGIIVLD